MKITAEKVWTGKGWLENACVTVEDGHVISVTDAGKQVCDYPYLVPGYVELHLHGGHFYRVEDPDPEAAKVWLREEARHGTTSLLASPSTNAPEIMRGSVNIFSDLMEKPVENGSRVLGIHLEGPFINPVRKGGMLEECILAPSVKAFREIAGEHEDAIRLISLAPEMPGADELIAFLVSRGIKVNAGHSDATSGQMKHAIALGLDGVTHFFNAARPIHHREPGLLSVGLITPSVFCEMIGDLVHLAPDTVRFLVQVAGSERITLITDAISYTGVPDGIYENGRVHVKDGSPRLADGTLLGSRYLMDRVVQSLIGIGIEPYDVFRMASATPAKRLGEPDIGDIAPGYRADLAALDADCSVLNTYIGGEPVHP